MKAKIFLPYVLVKTGELPATVSTSGPSEPLLSISAYPNPGLNDLTFSVNGFDPATLKVELIDELGQIIYKKRFDQ